MPSYVAFVVTKHTISRVDLGPAKPIEDVVTGWRDAIAKRQPDGDHPASLRRLVWDKIASLLPTPISVVYLAPDMALAGVPWAALPGLKPGTVLLDDHAILTVPHGHFLLGQLTTPHRVPGGERPLLLVSEVAYADAPAAPASTPSTGLLAMRAAVVNWKILPGTAREAEVFKALAGRRNLAVSPLSGADAGTDAVLSGLPKARMAHIGTHGFFADAKFRSVLQLDPKLFEMRGAERVGPAALSPYVLSGLVFAGANRPETPGRGILTAEAVLGADLSGMELAVLSACETGLGDVAGGEGVLGLQRAFHVAGCRNVLASLWKVDDDATAVLMGLFYRNLLVAGMAPAEALRQAQLTIYRNPSLIKKLGGRRAADFAEADLPELSEEPAADGETAPTWAWAAFTFSGVGSQPLVEPLEGEQPLPDSTRGVETVLWIGGGALVAALFLRAAWRWRRQMSRSQPADVPSGPQT